MVLKTQVLIFLMITFFLSSSKAQNDRKIEDVVTSSMATSYENPPFKYSDEQLINEQRLLHYSILTSYRNKLKPLPGLGSFDTLIDDEHGTIRFFMQNLSIIELLNLGFERPQNRVMLFVKDRSKYYYNSKFGSKNEWLKKNTFCFEYLMPKGALNDPQILRDEVAYYFGLDCKIEKKVVDCLILFKTSNMEKINSSGSSQGYFNDDEGRKLKINQLAKLVDSAGLPPMINETKYGGNIELNIGKVELKNLSDFKNALKKYDLDLKIDKREIEMLIIHELY